MKVIMKLIGFILLTINMSLFANTFYLGERIYKQEGSKWFNYSTGERGDQMVPNRMIIRKLNRSKPTPLDFNTLNLQGITIKQTKLFGSYFIIEVGSDKDPFSVAVSIYESEIFDYIEFDAIGTYFQSPNDDYFDNQWGLQEDKLQLEKAWDISTGNASVIVGNIDSGVDIRHVDLAENIWQNLGEDADGDGTVFDFINGEWQFDPDDIDSIDNDSNGRVDDFVGWDFNGLNGDNDPTGLIAHGTQVGGIISARTNNIEGISGVAGGWGENRGCSMMVLRKEAGNTGEVFAAATAECLTYAIQNGVDVINMSWGWSNHYPWYKAGIDSAVTDYNCVLVAAAGNLGNNHPGYPARYNIVIAVGASTQNDDLWENSNHGVELSVVAPGFPGSILSTDLSPNNNGYSNFGMTSAAAPHVTGIAALIRSIYSGLKSLDVKSIIELTADKVDSMDSQYFHIEYGYGRVNAYEAVLMAQYMVENNISALRTGDVFGDISENTLLAGNVNIVGSLDVQIGSNLHIYKGTEIKAHNTSFIFMGGGDLIINGTDDKLVTITSGSVNPSVGDWQGIIVESGNLEMNYCNLSYADAGVRFQGPGTGLIQNSQVSNCNTGVEYVPSLFLTPTSSFAVENSSVSNSDVGFHGFGGRISITDNYLIGANETGILLEQVNSFKISGNDIVLNNKAGIVARNSSGGFITDNVLSGNGSQADSNIDLITGGMFLHASSPIIKDNIIQHNQFHGITAMNNSQPVLNFRREGHNWFENNGYNDLHPSYDAEIRWHDRSIPFLDVGHNDILDEDGGYLIYGDVTPGDGPIPITRNYWADNDPNLFDRFYPLNAYEYVPYDTEPNVSDGQFTAAGAMFNQGLVYEENEDWDNAINTYQTIITTYPDSKEASGAVIRLFACTKMTDGDFTALQSYYDLLGSSYTDTDLSKTAEQYSILCDVAIQDFGTAIGKYEAILQNPPSLPDSVYAVIDIGQVYLASSVASGNGLGKKAALGTMPEYQPIDFADYEEKVNDALGALLGRKGFNHIVDIPVAFSLHANYPNPFNPTTTISYDIPEFSDVSIVVYDITGREIIELVNSNTLAGNQRVVWNGKDLNGNPVATGIYIYQLTAISNETGKIFSQSNKMVLLK